MSKARQAADEVNRQQAGRRNLIINGAMQVAQRGTSGSITTGSSSYKSLDRFLCYIGGADQYAGTFAQVSDAPDGFGYSAKVTTTTAETTIDADEYLTFRTRLERSDIQQFNYGSSNAKTTTLSFWVKSSVTGTYAIHYYLDRGTSPNQQKTVTYTINSANTWEYKTLVVTGHTSVSVPTGNAQGLELSWILGAGSTYTSGDSTDWQAYANAGFAYGQGTNGVMTTANATWQITGVQLEVGDVATPFEHRSYGEELALCQRYFNVWEAKQSGDAVATAALHTSTRSFGQYFYPVTMRADPTLVSSGTWSVNVGGNHRQGTTTPAINRATPEVAQIWLDHATGTAAGSAGWIKDNNSLSLDAKLQFDAEL